MKRNMMILAPLCLILCWMLPVDSMTIRFNLHLRENANPTKIPLTMSDDSVDDMYFGCHDEMMKVVKNKYLEEEKHEEPFKKAWNKAEECAEIKLKQIEDKALTKDHVKAICAYTGDQVYYEFNTAVRTNRKNYGSSSFQYHSLHFLLTSAIQILNSNYYCHTTYRRNRVSFTGKVDQIIRFGGFASTSFSTNVESFGNETCFKIKTCAGAPLEKFSSYESEAEVLIPPYEMFKITQIIERPVQIKGMTDCEVLFVLESVGVKSSLNCKAAYP